MKRLCLFRHAKSAYASIGMDDAERPLQEVGENNARIMGEALAKQHKFKPNLILASIAQRAHSTAKLLALELKYPEKKIMVVEKLYEAGVEDLLSVIVDLDNSFDSVLLVGHNPGLTLLANYLTDQYVNNLGTCGTIAMEFDTKEWENLAEAQTKILFTDEPRNHK